MGHDGPDELAEQRRKKQLTSVGRKLLDEIERAVEDSSTLPPAEILERMDTLLPADQAELVSILGLMAHEKAKATPNHWEEHERNDADLVRSATETIQQAQEQAAGRAVTPHMTIREALEVLRRPS